MGVTASSLHQAMSRRTIGSHVPGIAKAFGIDERVLVDEKLSDAEVLRRSVLALKAETRDLGGVTIGRIAWEDVEKGFGRGRFALLDRDKGTAGPGDLVAYWSDDEDGYVVRRLGDPDGKHVVLLNPHVNSKTEVRTSQWAAANLRRVLAICDMKATDLIQPTTGEGVTEGKK